MVEKKELIKGSQNDIKLFKMYTKSCHKIRSLSPLGTLLCVPAGKNLSNYDYEFWMDYVLISGFPCQKKN